jgi:hypothetical protein
VNRIAALVLVAVLVCLAWMISVAYRPEYLRLSSVQLEVVGVLALLLTAILLVSIVALRHTRSREGKEE